MKPRNNQFALSVEDYMGHTWILGATGGGKTNTLLYSLRYLLDPEIQKRFPSAVVLVDPHGYASMELARMVRPLGRVIILDPTYVAFGINPLALPKDFGNRNEIVKDRVGFLSSILTDVLNTDQANAPRLMWVFKGALFYLFSFGDNPTFRDLYLLLGEMHTEGRKDREKLRGRLKNRGVSDEIVQKTIESIAELDPNAFSPIMNRIANFVMPGKSMTSRTFCCRESTIDWGEIRKPGTVTIFRLSRALIADEDFRKLTMSLVIMNLFGEVQKQAREFERQGRPTSEMTNIVLAMDEFQWIGKLSVINTILSEARKFKLFLYMAHQNLGQLDKELLNTLSGNSGMIISHGLGPDDSRYIAKLLDPIRAEQIAKEIAGLAGHDCRLRKNPIYSREVRALALTFPKADEAYPFAYTEEQIKQYMRGIMETRYGGAHEAQDVIYETEEDKSEGGLAWWSPIQWYIMLLPYLDPIGFSELEERRVSAKFYRENGWSRPAVHNTFEDLVRLGYFSKRLENYQYAFSGTDDEGVPIGQKARPSNLDDIERTRTVVYTPTEKAKNWFISFFYVASSRAGGPVHFEVTKKLVHEYWLQGAFCLLDTGKEGGKRGDIRVIYPRKTEITDKKTEMKSLVSSAYEWDYDTAQRVEVEENPSKDPEHVFQNYLRDQGSNPVRFVVTIEGHVEVVRRILTDQHAIDPSKYTVEYLPIQNLNSPTPFDAAQPKVEQEQRSEAVGKKESFRREAVSKSSAPEEQEKKAIPSSPPQDVKQAGKETLTSVSQPTEPEAPKQSIERADQMIEVPSNQFVGTRAHHLSQDSGSVENPPPPQKETRVNEPSVDASEEIKSQANDDQSRLGGQKSIPTNPIEHQDKGKKAAVSSKEEKKTKEERQRDLMKGILLYMHKEGYPGREKLAKVMGVSAKTIDRYLDEMESRGVIEKTSRSSFTVAEFAAKAVVETEKRKTKPSQVDKS
ncbi:MAG: ATP-binding protein [Nitrososphaerota archaeon]|nr:ATP-binding protein [Nitrososphaerota archaeon]